MKKIIFLIISITMFLLQTTEAQRLRIDWAEPNSNNFSQDNIEICGKSRTLRFRVSHVRNQDPNCPYSGWGANRYRYTITLFRNGVAIGTQTLQTSSCWVNAIFNNINVTPGIYRATVQLEVRRFWWSWRTQFTGNTDNLIEVTRTPSEPFFTINNVVPNPEIPIEVCASKIMIDASGTTCEDKYNIGVWEFDYQNWSRTSEYEWGKWFNGQAPSSINLQQLSSLHSFGNDFSGNSIREGDILYGGKLPNGNDRYYYIYVCTGFPEWKCAGAVIKVKCDC